MSTACQVPGCDSRQAADWCVEDQRWMCWTCVTTLPAPNSPIPSASPSPRCDVPRPSSLIPCATAEEKDDEPEVETLLRMDADGELEPVAVVLPDLSDEATDAMRRVADFFALVAGLRLWAGDDRAVPFAVSWVAAKTGLPPRTAARAIRQLADAGVLVSAGAMPGRGKRGTNLYGPGVVADAVVVPFPERRTA